MRILFLTCDYPNPREPRKGPFNAALVRALRESGHDLHVVSPVSWITRLRRRASDVFGDSNVSRPPFFSPPKVLRRTYGACYWMSVRRTIRRLIDAHRPDVVLAYWAHPDGAAAVRAARACGATSAI